MNRAILYITLLCILLCPSQSEAAVRKDGDRGVHVEEISRVTHLTTRGANLYLAVNNSSGRRIVLQKGELDILINGVERINISLRDKVVIPRNHHGELLIPLRLRSTNSFALGAVLRRIARKEHGDIAISYRLRAGTSLYRRWFIGENITLSSLFDTFKISYSDATRLASYFD